MAEQQIQALLTEEAQHKETAVTIILTEDQATVLPRPQTEVTTIITAQITIHQEATLLARHAHQAAAAEEA